MAKNRDPFNFNIAKWKDSNNVLLFFLGSIAFGLAMGMGNALGTILMKGALKKIDRNTGLLPAEIKEEVNPDLPLGNIGRKNRQGYYDNLPG